MKRGKYNSMSELDTWWAKEEPVMRALYRDGASRYFAALPGIAGAFAEDGAAEATCIDEGIGHGRLRVAGSGVLLLVEEAVECMQRADVSIVTSHAECGAAGIAYRKAKGLRADESVRQEDVDAYAIERVKDIAARAGIEHRHIPFEQMDRPSGLHIARTVYVDGTGRFQPRGIARLPRGFVVSRRYLGAETTLHDVRLALSIAFGNHGFGSRFTPENPMVLVAIGQSDGGEFSAASLARELESVVREYGERVQIDCWIHE
jgi:hypothetical protein